MKQLKKWTALLLALMLMITLVPWSAKAEFAEPTTGTITVKGVEKDATVKAYRLTKAVFDANGNFLKYENLVTGTYKEDPQKPTFKDPQKPTDDEWKALIKKPVEEFDAANTTTLSADGADYKASGLKAGLYMILVTSSKGMVYNPMIVGLSYAKDDKGHHVNGGEIQVDQNFNLPDQAKLYAKKSEVPLSKTTEDPSPEDQSNPDSIKGNGLGLNEKPSFKITTTIPSYPTTDKELKFTITDTLDPGLTPPAQADVHVTVGGSPIDAANVTVTVQDQKITIDFKDAYLKSLNGASKDVVVTYEATLNGNASVNFAANKNTVVVEYTNDPKNGGTSKHEDITYHYTFDIDGLLKGKGSEQTHEITKHGDKITSTSKWDEDPLEGAFFGLYTEDPSQNPAAQPVQTVKTDATGRMNFTKLDEGKYYIKETQAPNGYSLDTTVHTAEISTVFNTDGTLASYSIKIDGTSTTTFTATYDKGTVTKVVTGPDNPVLIKNTTIPGLPTTGGMGTYLFTGIGVALLAGAAVMVTVLRKKNGQTTR